ncbi:calcium-binding protein [uncultured Roseobacter sp.]|uniref:calcium-binding protein n=1 Tax=uncultured Roseobacter sp. TaxID=114847 RepID=UPI00262CF523|nr:calcium-binding protein [uncultured Roseobacter sp.]
MFAWGLREAQAVGGTGSDIIGKIYDADGKVVYDSFFLNRAVTLGDQKSFTLAPTHDGFVLAYTDGELRSSAIRIERTFEDLSYVYGSVTAERGFDNAKLAVNLTPTNDDIFVAYTTSLSSNREFNARIIDENDVFSPTFSEQNPAHNSTINSISDVVVLSDGSFASLIKNGTSAYVSVVSENNLLLSETAVDTSIPVIAEGIASLAGGGFVVVNEVLLEQKAITAQVYASDGQLVGGTGPIVVEGQNATRPLVQALPDGGFAILFEAGSARYFMQLFNADATSASELFLLADESAVTSFPAIPAMTVTADGRIVLVTERSESIRDSGDYYASIWDPRGKVIDPDDYGQIRANFLATDTITTGVNGSIVLQGAPGDTILGQGGDDVIYTSASGDFRGGGGNDRFVLAAQFPATGDFRAIDGETGIDTLDTRAVTVCYTINLETGETSYPGAPATQAEAVLNIENLITGKGNDTITGSSLRNEIETGQGNDTVFAGDGDDVVRGQRGDDILNGENGNDTLNGGEGNDTILGGGGADTVYGQDGDDVIGGGDGNDQLFGEDGNDTINGGEGDDTIGGAFGNDVINAGDGNDTAFGGEGDDTVRGGAGNDRLFGSGGADFVDGEDGDDEIFGETGADTLLGGAGNDEINGGGGNDLMEGGDGADRMFGGSNDDRMFGGNDDDLIDGQQQDDELYGQGGDDTLFGGDGSDYLDGGMGNDTLFGGAQGDTLIGGGGADLLNGGGGFDTFDFKALSDSAFGAADTIAGFEGAGIFGGDVIDLSGIDANTILGGSQAFTFLGAVTSAVGLGFGAGALWVQEFGGQTRLYGEVDGDGAIDLEVRINDGAGTIAADYTADDFLF